ncbi:transmembrane protein 116 isoform X1 [Dendrobates tinctorius]|uniref:transmembrane protein 116 isoform X1 n=2 Tax=Dendrobates tinctorius TaxID=92724 RepID=UPI003CC9E05B
MGADVDYIFMWVNITEADELAEVYRNVKWIQVVTSMLSIVGSGSIIGYAVFQNAVRSPEVRPLFYLSLSDLFLAFCWLLGVVVYKADSSGLPCFNLQAVGQMLYLSTVLYTINFVWQTFSNFRRIISHDLNQISDTRSCIGRITTVLCSVIPVLFIFPVFYYGNMKECYGNRSHSCLVLNIGSQITDNTHRYDDCAVLHTYSTSVFMTAFCLATLCILAIVTYSCQLFKTYQKDARTEQDHWAVITVTRHSFLLFPSIFLFCSVPVVTLTLVSWKGIHSSYQALCYIQAFTAISQGFLNSLAYGWTQQMIRCLKQNSCRDVDTQTPLLRSQKNLYASMQTSNTYKAPRTVSAF